jgi:hypothetical protein
MLHADRPRGWFAPLLGGHKTGERREWYLTVIPMAEAIHEAYLVELEAEGLP